MIIVVQLFAGARELAGIGTVSVELASGATVAELRRGLAVRLPALVQLLARSRLAVNREFADDTAIVPDGAEIALIPPVSGG